MTVYDDGEKAKYRKQQKENKRQKLMIDQATEALLAHENGRIFLFWLLTIGKAIGQQPFTGNALSTSFACGELNVGNQILAQILEVNPDGLVRVLKENDDAGRADPERGDLAD